MPDTLDQVPPHPMEKGFHRPLAHPYVFVDGCVQIWPDADFATLNGHAVTASCITAFRPHDGPGEADVEKVLGGNWLRVFARVWGA